MRLRRLDTCFIMLLTVMFALSFAAHALGQAAAPAQAAPAGQQGVGQGLAPAPGGQAGQRGGQRGAQATPAVVLPTPRWPDGKVRLGAPPGEKGLWNGGGSTTSPDAPYQPWARAMRDYRRANEFEPHTRCKPSGGTRQFLTPYGVEIVDMPELQRVFILDVGGPHTFRTIFLDGRPHPKDLAPSYYGHSVGRWEGDTLVVDTVGFNERMWIDRGAAPHTEKLHLIEKFTRTDMNSMQYEVTIEDPGAYTAPFTVTSQMRFNQNQELFEFICQDNNFASELLVGQQESVDRSSPIIP